MAAIAFPTMLEFQSTLPVRGATAETGVHALAKGISIHAPREGSDQMRQTVENLAKISIHAPREGSDYYRYLTHQDNPEFQSTLPVRGATGPSWTSSWTAEFQSTLPVRGATKAPEFCIGIIEFQSTLPVRGATELGGQTSKGECKFQSTLPVRGATRTYFQAESDMIISIHAPREGSDSPPPTDSRSP